MQHISSSIAVYRIVILNFFFFFSTHKVAAYLFSLLSPPALMATFCMYSPSFLVFSQPKTLVICQECSIVFCIPNNDMKCFIISLGFQCEMSHSVSIMHSSSDHSRYLPYPNLFSFSALHINYYPV